MEAYFGEVTGQLVLRIGIFLTILIIMGSWESILPAQNPKFSKVKRWRDNLSLAVLNNILLRVTLPVGAVGIASIVETKGWGLLNWVSLNSTITIILSIIVLDLIIYLQHKLVHVVPWLWNIHRVHHTDLDYDVTTGVRFHPFEIVFSMLIKFLAISLLGAPVLSVFIFELVLSAMSLFNHGNVRLPIRLDRFLRYFIVTPDMHRIHHSTDYHESNSNFGFNLSCWDRLFGTYLKGAELEQNKIQTGVLGFGLEAETSTLPTLLALPFSQNQKV